MVVRLYNLLFTVVFFSYLFKAFVNTRRILFLRQKLQKNVFNRRAILDEQPLYKSPCSTPCPLVWRGWWTPSRRCRLHHARDKRTVIYIVYGLYKRETAKKVLFFSGQITKALTPVPLPLELSSHWNFCFSLKIAENGFWQLILP